MVDSDIISGKNHELLIRVDEQLKNLTREVRDMHTNVNQDVAVLKETKMGKAEAVELFAELKKVTDTHETSIEDLKLQAGNIKTMVKTVSTIGVSILALLQIIQILIAIGKSS